LPGGTGEKHEKLSYDNLYPGRDSNRALPE
jgi:hypothetical protein